MIFVCLIFVFCVVVDLCFLCICVTMFEVLLVSSIAATTLVFDLCDFNYVTV